MLLQTEEVLGESDQRPKNIEIARATVQLSRPFIRCWTDGSVLPSNPGPGGWAFYAYYTTSKGERVELKRSGSNPFTSNIRMELIAVLRLLQCLKKPSRVFFLTDSQYIIDGLRNMRRDKLLKTHYDVWGLILHLSQVHQISTSKVKAHSGVEENEMVDFLAKKAAREQLGDPFMWPTETIMAKLLNEQKSVERIHWEKT